MDPQPFLPITNLSPTMDTNIDKEKFNRNCQLWVRETEPQSKEWLYTKYLHKDILTIIKNTTYHWDFFDQRLLYDDVEAELLMHLQYKKDKLRAYPGGSWYNLIFTLFRRKLLDIMRSHRDQNKNLERMHEYCLNTKDSIEMNNIIDELEEEKAQEPRQPGSRQPIAVSTNDNELIPDPALPAILTESYSHTVSSIREDRTPSIMEETAEYKALCERIYKVIYGHIIKLANAFNTKLPEEEKEAIRQEECNDPTYLDTDAVIWSYEQSKFVPNIQHLKREAKRNADDKIKQLFG